MCLNTHREAMSCDLDFPRDWRDTKSRMPFCTKLLKTFLILNNLLKALNILSHTILEFLLHLDVFNSCSYSKEPFQWNSFTLQPNFILSKFLVLLGVKEHPLLPSGNHLLPPSDCSHKPLPKAISPEFIKAAKRLHSSSNSVPLNLWDFSHWHLRNH